MVTSIKRLLVGNPLRTEQATHERLSKKTALAVFSSDALFAAPTYAFIICILFMIGYGLFHYLVYGGGAAVAGSDELKIAEGYRFQPVTLFLILGAFSNGCAALTGIEAISNGVPAFKKPEARNAAATLVVRGVVNALQYARAISANGVKAAYVDFDEEATRRLQEKWEQWGSGVELVVLPSPYRSLRRPLLRYIERLRRKGSDDFVTVVLPEFIPARWWQHFLHNQSSLLLKGALLFKKCVVVVSVPYHLER
ncbi:MAG TPA: hypothetical protein VN256_26950 [Pyrinomonadaceae bacterium]|nr:hypothetical protein [Pyrinomonadaceae bacterium]